MAVSAIDMALWDALARSHNSSLVQLLGSTEKPIPAYGAVGSNGVKGLAQVAEHCAWWTTTNRLRQRKRCGGSECLMRKDSLGWRSQS